MIAFNSCHSHCVACVILNYTQPNRCHSHQRWTWWMAFPCVTDSTLFSGLSAYGQYYFIHMLLWLEECTQSLMNKRLKPGKWFVVRTLYPELYWQQKTNIAFLIPVLHMLGPAATTLTLHVTINIRENCKTVFLLWTLFKDNLQEVSLYYAGHGSRAV
jgi:hypothetical protein